MKIVILLTLLIKFISSFRMPSYVLPPKNKINICMTYSEEFFNKFTINTENSYVKPGYVMLFNVGETTEGIYTLHSDNFNSVLAFESSLDAHEFARNLVTNGFDQATVLHWTAILL